MQARPVVTIDQLPSDINAIVALRDKLSSIPEGGVAILVAALIMYVENENEGKQALVVACDKNLLMNDEKGYKGFSLGQSTMSLVKMLQEKKHVPYSYIKGTSPDTGYKPASGPYVIETFTNPSSGDETSGKLKLFVKCSGADSERPVTLHKNDKGIWKAYEYSSLLIGVRQPKTSDGDDI